jgi:hypothetical protein
VLERVDLGDGGEQAELVSRLLGRVQQRGDVLR